MKSFLSQSSRLFVKNVLLEMKYFSLRPHQVKHFLIISQERTGSTVLMDLLASHPSILVDHHQFYSIDFWPSFMGTFPTPLTRKPVHGYKFKIAESCNRQTPDAVNSFINDRQNAGMQIILPHTPE